MFLVSFNYLLPVDFCRQYFDDMVHTHVCVLHIEHLLINIYSNNNFKRIDDTGEYL